EFWGCRFTLLRGAAIGAAIGAVPGIGSSAAAFLSYASAKHAALRRGVGRGAGGGAGRETPPDFGRGNPHGIAATESANSAVVGANLIPLLTLGLPGNVGAALIISALLIQGIQPGPLLFAEHGRLIYGLFGLMLASNAANLLVGQFGMRLWVLVVRAPASVIFASALLLCFVGVYSASGDIFGLKVMLLFSVIGVLMRFFGFSVVAFIIAFILGPRFELSLSQALTITNRDPAALLAHPVGIAFLALAALAIYVFAFRRHAAPA
ncbi:MAG: tripartite tricarboxylate transporter permease, partial [Gammaproteobacteria bacterium]